MNNKGILRVKMLTIIILMGIILFVLIPKTIDYYNNRRKENYIQIATKYINEVKDSINSLEYKQIPLENEALLVKISNLSLSKKTPYGMLDPNYSYVIVLNCGDYYEYYFACIDSTSHGIPMVSEKSLNIESIVYGEDALSQINHVDRVENLYIANTIYSKSEKTREDDKNILLSPVSGDLTVPYEFKRDVHSIYSDTIKNIDTNIYSKEVLINNGKIKYDNKIISYGYRKDLNGLFRYIAFPNNNKANYYASFVVNNNSYVAGVINKDGNYSNKNMIFDSIPTIVINETSDTILENNQKYLMWNLMTLSPNNDNYVITECGALIIKNSDDKDINITFDTPRVLVGKSNNNCELGNIFAIRKDNVKEKDKYSARGYIKYKDRFGIESISYSRDTVIGVVE